MKTRKELKKEAKNNVKNHIIFFIIVCAIAAFIGSEFKGSLLISLVGQDSSFDNVMNSILENGVEETKKKIDDYIIKQKDNETQMLGRTNGVFASSLNAISSGSLYMIGFTVFKNVTNSPTVILAVTIIIALLIYFIFWYYIVNVYQIVLRRLLLEGRTYKKIPFRRITYLSRVKKLNRASKTMFIAWLYQRLWDLTIIGGIIKHYSYLMVPYIIAENPSLNSKQAITLSRNMMNGYKFEAFKLDLSFIGWNLLGMLTFGISAIAFSNPYEIATFTEFYAELRKIAKENQIENAELLNDTFLYELADIELINKEYADIIEIINQEDYKFENYTGFKHILHDFFGIHSYTEEEKLYEKQQLKEFVVDEYTPVIEKQTYPFRLFTIKPKDKKHRIESLNYLRHYSLISIICMFFIISFFGWLWEVVLYLINEGIFVNRGTLQGPWLPIYGGGSILILLCLNKYRKNVLLQFTLAVILCGILEYFTSVILEATHNGIRWWDYSGYFLNLHGRICAEGLLTFGFGGLAMVYFVAPAIDNKIREMNKKVLGVIAIVLIAVYGADMVYSAKNPNTGRGINDYNVSSIESYKKIV
ncbi:MAG: DUF975 family protein [Clostridia bacterium]|nr:DUF975 family protein [Clostridia bacterium]